jgi:hypothetical protein
MKRAAGTSAQTAWLNIAGEFGIPRLLRDDLSNLVLDDADSCQAAMRANASPEPGSDLDGRLLAAVLNGWCSDVATTSTSHAGALLRAMRPHGSSRACLSTTADSCPSITCG